MTIMKQRRDTAANWTAANPVLASGEFGLETDTRKMKFGDGTSTWTALDYITGSGDSETVAAATELATPDTLVMRDEFGQAAFTRTFSTDTPPADPAELTRKDYVDDAVAAKVDQVAVEGLVLHDGTTGGGTRPSGFWRVRWVGGTARPTNMAPEDVWERAA